VRDFIILHYHVNQRQDSAFWKDCAAMDVPPSLKQKMALYRSHGRMQRFNNELFTEYSWLQVYEGQNFAPESYHPLVDVQTPEAIQEYMEGVRQVIGKCVDVMPTHQAYIDRYCKAGKPAM
jgi:tryptophan halogenase